MQVFARAPMPHSEPPLCLAGGKSLGLQLPWGPFFRVGRYLQGPTSRPHKAHLQHQEPAGEQARGRGDLIR